MRVFVVASAIALTTLLAGLTLLVLVRSGPDVLTLAALVVLALFAVGIFGALLMPPDDRR